MKTARETNEDGELILGGVAKFMKPDTRIVVQDSTGKPLFVTGMVYVTGGTLAIELKARHVPKKGKEKGNG